MQSKLLHNTGGQRTFAVILATGDEVIGEAHVRPTLEVILTESPAHLRKRHDPESGLALIRIDA